MIITESDNNNHQYRIRLLIDRCMFPSHNPSERITIRTKIWSPLQSATMATQQQPILI